MNKSTDSQLRSQRDGVSTPEALLSEYFGFDSFRARQAEIIRHVGNGRHAMVVMPTGMGKSLCYQIPAPELVPDFDTRIWYYTRFFVPDLGTGSPVMFQMSCPLGSPTLGSSLLCHPARRHQTPRVTWTLLAHHSGRNSQVRK